MTLHMQFAVLHCINYLLGRNMKLSDAIQKAD